MFYRQATDGTRTPIPLEGMYAGPVSTPCWIVGGGPSLTEKVAEQISRSPAPKFGINLSGSGVIRPQFWTSYDPTCRFHRSIYLDSSIVKFVHLSRAMDLVPGTTFKVCDSPSLYFIDREKQRGFHNFPGVGTSPITDWQDSLIQAIDIAYRLGFRRLYLAGTDMFITPSRRWLQAGTRCGVQYSPGEPLREFVRRCGQAGMTRKEMEEYSTGPQYHFDETKSLAAAIQTDFHYYRVSQFMRLSRRSMGLAGLQLISVVPRSRLNDYFPRVTVATACREILLQNGDPMSETTRGKYSVSSSDENTGEIPMRDFRPHFWDSRDQKSNNQGKSRISPRHSHQASPPQALFESPVFRNEIAVDLNEFG